jgi:hypothetical protein
MSEFPPEISWTEALRGISVDSQTKLSTLVINVDPRDLTPEERGKNIEFEEKLRMAVGYEHSGEVGICLAVTMAVFRKMPSTELRRKEPTLEDVSRNLDNLRNLPSHALNDTELAILTQLCAPRR